MAWSASVEVAPITLACKARPLSCFSPPVRGPPKGEEKKIPRRGVVRGPTPRPSPLAQRLLQENGGGSSFEGARKKSQDLARALPKQCSTRALGTIDQLGVHSIERSKLACPPAPRAQSLQKGNDRRAKRRSDSTDAPVTQTNGPGSRQHCQNGALLGSCSHSTGVPVTQRVGYPPVP